MLRNWPTNVSMFLQLTWLLKKKCKDQMPPKRNITLLKSALEKKSHLKIDLNLVTRFARVNSNSLRIFFQKYKKKSKPRRTICSNTLKNFSSSELNRLTILVLFLALFQPQETYKQLSTSCKLRLNVSKNLLTTLIMIFRKLPVMLRTFKVKDHKKRLKN